MRGVSSFVVLMVAGWPRAFNLCDARQRWELHNELMLMVGCMCVPYDYDYDYIMAPQRGRPYGANLGSMGRNTGTWSIRSEHVS